MSRQVIYMRQRSGHGRLEFTDSHFSCDAVHNAIHNAVWLECNEDYYTWICHIIYEGVVL